MSVNGIDHANIRTSDIEASLQFYSDVLQLDPRRGPEARGRRGHWLYDSRDKPIIHFWLMEADDSSNGPIDHIALECDDQEGLLTRLDARGIKYDIADDLFVGVTQVFIIDPHGVRLELICKQTLSSEQVSSAAASLRRER